MNQDSPMAKLAVSRLLEKNPPLVPEQRWSTLSGSVTYDGSVIRFDGTPREKRELEAALSRAEMEGKLVVWTPREKRQPGRIPRCLRCGFTVVRYGRHLVAFQSVVYVPHGVIDLVASTSTGYFVTIGVQSVSSWDGTSIDDMPSPHAVS